VKVFYSRTFQKDFQHLPERIHAQAEKQLTLFVENPHHPSLGVKRIQGAPEFRWEGRVSRRYRFTFDWEGDTVVLRRIGKHEVTDQEAGR
jgi:mRNA-degrading endonuclease RelE of RelBE toxin-antitoxin system